MNRSSSPLVASAIVAGCDPEIGIGWTPISSTTVAVNS